MANSVGVILKRNGSTELVGPCPICKEGTDRFYIKLKAIPEPFCGCNVCGYWANEDKFATDFNLKKDEVADRKHYQKFVPIMPAPEDPVDPMFRVSPENEKAIEYFAEWGISRKTLEDFSVTDAYGSNYRGAAIPHYCHWTAKRLGYIYRAYKGVDAKKYLFDRSMPVIGYYNNWFLNTPDLVHVRPPKPYCFIVESQKDVWLLTQMGYYATAFKGNNAWLHYSENVFLNIMQPIIIEDNDGGRGRNIALKVLMGLKDRAKITNIREAKQITDLAQARGYDYALEYMQENFKWLTRTSTSFPKMS